MKMRIVKDSEKPLKISSSLFPTFLNALPPALLLLVLHPAQRTNRQQSDGMTDDVWWRKGMEYGYW
jgi:hypothetical protein